MKEKLNLLERVPESAINRAARTLLDLRETWENTTMEERKDLARMMIQEAGCDVGTKRIVWVKVNPDYEILFRLMDGLRPDAGRRYWIREQGAHEDIVDISRSPEERVFTIGVFNQYPCTWQTNPQAPAPAPGVSREVAAPRARF